MQGLQVVRLAVGPGEREVGSGPIAPGRRFHGQACRFC